MRALEMAPRVSGGVAHAMAVGVLCQLSERLWSVQKSPRIRSTCARGTAPRSSGQSGPARAGSSGPRTALVPHPDDATGAACDRARFRGARRSTIVAMLSALAITQSMLDLCSPPCKARRFAPPAQTPTPTRIKRASGAPGARPSGLDGTCAQIAFWQLRDGRR